MKQRDTKQRADFNASISRLYNSLGVAFLLGSAVNVLILAGPLFLLQVYERVLPSRSIPTLFALFSILICAYIFLFLFDLLRAKFLGKVGVRFEVDTGKTVLKNWQQEHQSSAHVPNNMLKACENVRQYFNSPGPASFVDLSWVPVYLGFIYLLHSALAAVVLLVVIVMIALAFLQRALIRKPKHSLAECAESLDQEQRELASSSNSIVAMGMQEQLANSLTNKRNKKLVALQLGTNVSEVYAAFFKTIRFFTQSLVLAVGAYLVVISEISAGSMIVASIVSGRVLLPIDQSIIGWDGYQQFKKSIQALRDGFKETKTTIIQTTSADCNTLSVSDVVLVKRIVGNNGRASSTPVLNNICFELTEADCLGVIGPNSAGKSVLLKVLAGVLQADFGTIRIGDSTSGSGKKCPKVGFLGSENQLLSGTLAQNISRFEHEPDMASIEGAAKQVGIHKEISELVDGYEALLADVLLPDGLLRRIAIARAIYKSPRLVLLDEPYAGLDDNAERALENCIQQLRNSGSIVVIASHRPSAMRCTNKLLVLDNGKPASFGDQKAVVNSVGLNANVAAMRAS